MHAHIHDMVILTPFLLLLSGSILLSIQTRFIQLRTLPYMFGLLKASWSNKNRSANTIPAHEALFTAMSTTIGIGNIAGPLIAIGLGGPGAMLGFLLATIFGAATTFVEVSFAGRYKDPAPAGQRVGGPMFYLNQIFPPFVSYLYATLCFLMLVVWSGGQSNALATILVPYAIPRMVTGILLAIFTLFIIGGGITRVGKVAEKTVPIMFFLYAGAMVYIILVNITQLPRVIALIFTDAFSPKAIGSGVGGAGIVQALRWGLARGYQSNEAGIGTATIPHSKAETSNSLDQGILSIVSVFSNGILCMLTGLAVLVTGVYKEYSIESISLLTKLFAAYFPYIGPSLFLFSAILFATGTVIGNSYNGSQLFLYVLGKRMVWVYYIVCSLSIFVFSMFPLDFVWDIIDYLVLPVAISHIVGIVLLAFSRPHELAFCQRTTTDYKKDIDGQNRKK